MSVVAFLLISLIVHAIPIPFSTEMLRPNRLIKWLPFKLVWGTAAWALICLFMNSTLPWAVITLVLSFGALMVVGTLRDGGM